MNTFKLVGVLVMLFSSIAAAHGEAVDQVVKNELDISVYLFSSTYKDELPKSIGESDILAHMARADMYVRLYLEAEQPADWVLPPAQEHAKAAIYQIQSLLTTQTKTIDSLETLSAQIARDIRAESNLAVAVVGEHTGSVIELLYQKACKQLLEVEALYKAFKAEQAALTALHSIDDYEQFNLPDAIKAANQSVLAARSAAQVTGMAWTNFESCKKVNTQFIHHIESLLKLLDGKDKEATQTLKNLKSEIIDFDKKRKSKQLKAFLERYNLQPFKVKKTYSEREAWCHYHEACKQVVPEVNKTERTHEQWYAYLVK